MPRLSDDSVRGDGASTEGNFLSATGDCLPCLCETRNVGIIRMLHRDVCQKKWGQWMYSY